MCLPSVFRGVAVLKEAGCVIVIVCGECFRRGENFSCVNASLMVAFAHGPIVWRAIARLIDAFLPISFVQRTQLFVDSHIARYGPQSVFHRSCIVVWTLAIVWRSGSGESRASRRVRASLITSFSS